jgi:hypothetical protein|tara:strand:- start:1677 stop:1967 length:291 start_codon:yes stop_codon:yes gene_type:complete
MLDSLPPIITGAVSIHTTYKRGLNVEEIAKMALDKVVHISENAPPAIRDQAHAYKNALGEVLVYYLKMAVDQDRATICSTLRETGHSELAEQIRKL